MPLTDPEIFEQARQIQSPEERLSYLGKSLRDDAQLDRLKKLLDVDLNDSFLENATAAFEELQGTVDRSGEIIDSYRLLKKIGHGGMGVVYRAEQFKPIQRTVAIKLIRIDASVDKVVPRFKSERQALAIMEHPNIARFYDAGTTSRGNPYFVMEYVDGMTLTKYCDANRLTIAERLKLFRKICNAVIHAHKKGIVHRDLKPGNIIVTQIDGKAVPKVIDFGLAKSEDAQWNHETMDSDFGQLLGTLAYMSPEQADRSNDEIDGRSDVYSLGIILYELLVGTPPFSPLQFKQVALDEVIRIIRDSEPPTLLSSLESAQSNSEIADQRQLDASQLQRLVRGDLELIVMKTLEKEPVRRYQTAEELAADIDRFAKQEPVQARIPSLLYKSRKIIRRNRHAVSLASITLIAVSLGFLLSSLLGYKRQTESESFVIAVGNVEQLVDDNNSKALAELDSLDQRYPDNLRLLLLRASIYEKQEDYEQQIQTLSRAIKLNPDNCDARIERARAYQLASPANLILASQDLEKVLSLRKGDPKGTRLLRELNWKLPLVSNNGQCVIMENKEYGVGKTFSALPDGTRVREIKTFPQLDGPRLIVDSDDTSLFFVQLQDGRTSAKMKSSHDGISISKDGSFIIYQDRTNEDYDLVRMNFDGSDQKKLIEGRFVYTPVISPDGKKVAFMIHDEGDFEIGMMNVDGTGFRVLTRSKGRDGGLAKGAWGKDSKQLAFMSERKQVPRWTYVIDVTTLETTELGPGKWPYWADVDEFGNFKPRSELHFQAVFSKN